VIAFERWQLLVEIFLGDKKFPPWQGACTGVPERIDYVFTVVGQFAAFCVKAGPRPVPLPDPLAFVQ